MYKKCTLVWCFNLKQCNILVFISIHMNTAIVIFTIVFEDFNFGSRQSCPKHKWGMVQLITDYQISLTHQGGYVGGVGSKTHPKRHCGGLAKKTCHESLQFIMKVKSTWWRQSLSYFESMFQRQLCLESHNHIANVGPLFTAWPLQFNTHVYMFD